VTKAENRTVAKLVEMKNGKIGLFFDQNGFSFLVVIALRDVVFKDRLQSWGLRRINLHLQLKVYFDFLSSKGKEPGDGLGVDGVRKIGLLFCQLTVYLDQIEM
jgi:hypothetical protein